LDYLFDRHSTPAAIYAGVVGFEIATSNHYTSYARAPKHLN